MPCRRKTALAAALAAALALAAPPLSAEDVVPPPAWARSVEVVDDGAPLVVAPKPAAKRRGTVREGTRLPLRERLYGGGCPTGVYFRVGDQAHVCEHHVKPSPHRARSAMAMVTLSHSRASC